jgi:hypothetical protein
MTFRLTCMVSFFIFLLYVEALLICLIQSVSHGRSDLALPSLSLSKTLAVGFSLRFLVEGRGGLHPNHLFLVFVFVFVFCFSIVFVLARH